ncbi:MAG: type II secretion system F family protein [Kiritimatiellaeota bacterium]|nr:type II secretion system F family protein [Kiritimatiellota bacterium]
MNGLSLGTYALVFLSVVAPFLVADVWVRLPKKVPSEIPGYAGFPALYQRFYMLIAWAADGAGNWLLLRRPARTEKLRNLLLLANAGLPPQMVYGAQCVFAAMLGGAVLALVFFMGGAPGAAAASGAVGALLGWVYPPTVLESAAQKRQEELIRKLPFAIDLITSAMQAGLDFNAAVRYYTGAGFKDALTAEFGVLLREVELGKSRVEGLQDMARRVQTDGFTSFVDAVSHGMEVGASIVETLRMQGEGLRRARFALAEQKAARAPSIMIFPLALFILPAVFIIIFVPVFYQFKSSGM